MNRPPEDQSLMELLAALTSSIPNLMRDEFDLLKVQLQYVLVRLQAASSLVVVATALAFGAVTLLIAAAVGGAALLLMSLGLEGSAAVTLASLAIALLAALLAAALVLAARSEISRARSALGRSIEAVVGADEKQETTN
jgi:hypothetical protein